MQKLNNDQLRQLYFQRSTPSKSFHKQSDHIKNNESRQSFFDTPINYERFSESEIARFENFFNTYLYPTPQDYIFKQPQTSSEAHELFETKAAHQSDPHLKLEKKHPSIEAELSQTSQLGNDLLEHANISHKVQEDHDFTYLESLMNLESNKDLTPNSSSLSDIFAEIIDNEKKSTSNYESSVFDANVQMLFNEDVATSPRPTSKDATSATKVVAPPTPPPPIASMPTVELPPPPPVVPKVATTPTVQVEKAETLPQELETAPVEDSVLKKTKKAKFKLLDVILIFIVLTILGALVFHFWDSLPF